MQPVASSSSGCNPRSRSSIRKPSPAPNVKAHLHRRQESRQLWKTGMPPGSGAATCSVPLLLASHLLPSERLCERDGEAIGIDAYSKPDALVYLLSRCQDKMCASCLQFRSEE